MEPEDLISGSFSMKVKKLGWVLIGVISAVLKGEWRLLLSHRERGS